jgi:hypothetical protein
VPWTSASAGDCPAGTGGQVYIVDDNAGNPVPGTRRAVCNGATGAPGPAGAVGPQGPAGPITLPRTQVLQGSVVANTPGGPPGLSEIVEGIGQAICPSGYVATGGGFELRNNITDQVSLLTSEPLVANTGNPPYPTGWWVLVRATVPGHLANPAGPKQVGTVFVVCVPIS